MLKNVTLAALTLLLLAGTGSAVQAQSGPQFSIAPPANGVVQIPSGTDLGLKNSADLSPEEFKAAIEKSTCGNVKADKSATLCAACTGAGCTGTCYAIPCGFFANANQQVPPAAGFLSFVTGCNTTVVSTCNNLSNVAPCQAFGFASAVWGNNTCINSPFLLQSVGCFL